MRAVGVVFCLWTSFRAWTTGRLRGYVDKSPDSGRCLLRCIKQIDSPDTIGVMVRFGIGCADSPGIVDDELRPVDALTQRLLIVEIANDPVDIEPVKS